MFVDCRTSQRYGSDDLVGAELHPWVHLSCACGKAILLEDWQDQECELGKHGQVRGGGR